MGEDNDKEEEEQEDNKDIGVMVVMAWGSLRRHRGHSTARVVVWRTGSSSLHRSQVNSLFFTRPSMLGEFIK